MTSPDTAVNEVRTTVSDEEISELLAFEGDLALHAAVDPFKMRALLTELQHRREAEAGTPEGWVRVPRDLTLDMEQAHYGAHAKAETVFASAQEVWSAMLAASPSSPASGVRVSEEQQEKEAAFVAAGGAKRVDGHYSNADTGVVGTVPTEVYLSYEAQAKEIAARSETETQTAIKNSILLFVLKARMAENEQCAALIEDRGKNNVGRVHPVDAGHAAAIRSRLSALGEHP